MSIKKRQIEEFIIGEYFVEGSPLEIYEDFEIDELERLVDEGKESLISFLLRHNVNIVE